MKHRLVIAYCEDGGDRERGSAALELVLATPLLVLVMLVVVAFGLLVAARLQVSDAAHQAARAASLARSEGAARDRATHTANAALHQTGSTCARTDVQVTTGGLRPGGTVTVKLTCTADLGKLTRTGLPGHAPVSGTAFSVIDTYRSDAP